jgi:hypothetical protein
MYASIRQGKAKAGQADELARKIKEEALPIISDVPGFRAYYVVYAPDDTVTAISIFDDYAGAVESNDRLLPWIKKNVSQLLSEPVTAAAGAVIVHTLA